MRFIISKSIGACHHYLRGEKTYLQAFSNIDYSLGNDVLTGLFLAEEEATCCVSITERTMRPSGESISAKMCGAHYYTPAQPITISFVVVD